ncbi:MAG TPA: hypothetical protein VF228_07960 [Iamia sp.]
MAAVRTTAVVLAMAIALVGCGDPLADKLESSGKQPYSDDDPSLIDPNVTTTLPGVTTAVPAAGAPTTAGPEPVAPTTVPVAPPQDREDFVAEIERGCAARNQQVGSSALNQGGMATPQDALRIMGTLVSSIETTAAVLRGRTPPAGDEAVVADLIGGLDHFVGLMRPVLDAGGFRSEAERDALLATLRTDGDVITARFDAYGLPSCF